MIYFSKQHGAYTVGHDGVAQGIDGNAPPPTIRHDHTPSALGPASYQFGTPHAPYTDQIADDPTPGVVIRYDSSRPYRRAKSGPR